MPPRSKKTKHKSAKRVRAGRAGALERERHKKVRSAAAQKGWQTRKQNQRQSETKRKFSPGRADRSKRPLSAVKGTAKKSSRTLREKRSEAAKRGWKTRRKNERKRKRKIIGDHFPRNNQEYYVTIIDRQRGSKKGKKESPLPPKQPGAKGKTHFLPDFIVIHDKGLTETAIVAYLIYWIESEGKEENRWWANVVRHAWQTARIVIASGPETKEQHGVKLN